MPEFMPISLRIGPLTTEIVAKELVLLDRALTPLAASARITGKYSGRAPGHDRVHRHLLHGELPELAKGRRAQPSHDLVGWMARAFEHRLDARLGRERDRQEIGPAVLLEQPVQALFGVWLEQPRRRALEGLPLQVRFVERTREAVDHLLHEGPLRHGIGAVDVGAQVGGRSIDHRLRHVRLPQARHAHGERGGADESGEDVGVHPDGGDAGFFERRGEPDDRRATRASKADAEDGRVAVSDDPRAHLLIVGPGLARLNRADVHAGQVLAEPLPQLLGEHVRVVEQAIDQVDRLSLDRLRPRRQTLADYLRRIATGIVQLSPLRSFHAPCTAARSRRPRAVASSTGRRAIAAVAPSPAAAAARPADPDRTVPAANSPGRRLRIASSVGMRPDGSSSSRPFSHAVSGVNPT